MRPETVFYKRYSEFMLRNHKVSFIFVAVYAVLAAVLMSSLLDTGFRNSTVWPEGDASLAIWACAFVAHLPNWLHLYGPFYTDSIYYPHGLNLLANTTSVGLAIFMMPVTWILGPLAAFNTSVFASIVLSATSMMWSLKRVVPNSVARGFAGLVWAFSPFAMGAFYWGWTNFLFLAVPPLIFWGLVELVHADIPPRRLGLTVGIALGLQTLIGGEVAAITVVAVVATFLITGIPYLLVRRHLPAQLTWRRLRSVGLWTLTGFAPIAVPTALFVALGPAHLNTWVWPEWVIKSGWSWSGLVNNPIGVGSLAHHWDPIYPSAVFFGWPAVIATGIAMVFVRNATARIVSILGLIGVWFINGVGAAFNPLAIMWNLPLFRNIVAFRFVLATWFAVAVLTAFVLERAMTFFRSHAVRPLLQIGSIAICLIVVFYQPANAIIGSAPWHTQSPRHEISLTEYSKSLSEPKVVMPFPLWKGGASIIQQAREHLRIKLVSGWGPQPGFTAREGAASIYLVQMGTNFMGLPTRFNLQEANFFINSRQTDTILIPRHFSIPRERGYLEPYQMTALLTYMYGPPQPYLDAWKWERPKGRQWQLTPTMGPLTAKQWKRCAWGLGRINPRGIPLCVVKAAGRSRS